MSNVVRLLRADSPNFTRASEAEAVAQQRRSELGSFLRSRRASLTPADVNVRPVGRRHVKGLRREEVAQLAGIGTSWYTLLEQGRVKTVSERTLERVADALRITTVERDHLLELARNSFHRDVFDVAPGEATLSFVDRFDGGPALLITAAFDVVAANSLAGEIYRFAGEPGSRWNLIAHLLADEYLHEIFPRWRDTARSMVGVLRSNYGRFSNLEFDAILEGLRRASPLFADLWNSHEVTGIPSETCDVVHPLFGSTKMQLHALVHADSPSHTIICLTRTLHSA